MDNKRLRSQMILCGIDRKILAEHFNVNYYTISNKIDGKTNWTPEEIKNLSQLLNCTTDYLLGK